MTVYVLTRFHNIEAIYFSEYNAFIARCNLIVRDTVQDIERRHIEQLSDTERRYIEENICVETHSLEDFPS